MDKYVVFLNSEPCIVLWKHNISLYNITGDKSGPEGILKFSERQSNVCEVKSVAVSERSSRLELK